MMLAWFSSSEMTASSCSSNVSNKPAVGIETGAIENRVFGAEKLAESRFELFVDGLRAANETHTGAARIPSGRAPRGPLRRPPDALASPR